MVHAKILDSCREYIAGFDQDTELEPRGFNDEDSRNSLDEFKQKIITMLTSLLEGEVDQYIMNRMSVSMDFGVMKERMAKVFAKFCYELLGSENIDFEKMSINQISKRLNKDSFDSNVSEAFEIYILIHSLADYDKNAQMYLSRESFTTPLQWKANEFIRQHTARIEINRNNVI